MFLRSLYLLIVAISLCTADVTWDKQLDQAPWAAREMLRGGMKDGYIYIIGGSAGTLTLYGDTWRTDDGVTWEQQSGKQGWGKRSSADVAIVGESLVLTGGQGLFSFYNDVWRSDDDGKSWTQVNPNAQFGKRSGHVTVVIDEDILLFSGAKCAFGRSFYNDVWISHDKGSSWSLQSQLPEDMGRAGMQIVHFNQSLYFMGGDHDNPVFVPNITGRRNDVWQSDDMGVTWCNIGNATWSPRTGHQCGVMNEMIYCMGGQGTGADGKPVLFHDVWSWNPASTNVSDWKMESSTGWGCEANSTSCGRENFLLVVQDQDFWTFGGSAAPVSPYQQCNDVWAAELSG